MCYTLPKIRPCCSFCLDSSSGLDLLCFTDSSDRFIFTIRQRVSNTQNFICCYHSNMLANSTPEFCALDATLLYIVLIAYWKVSTSLTVDEIQYDKSNCLTLSALFISYPSAKFDVIRDIRPAYSH